MIDFRNPNEVRDFTKPDKLHEEKRKRRKTSSTGPGAYSTSQAAMGLVRAARGATMSMEKLNTSMTRLGTIPPPPPRPK